MTDTEPKAIETERLQVVLAADTMGVLRQRARRKSISLSEAIRRAISAWDFLERERERGTQLAVIEELPNGELKITNVVLLG